MRKTTNYGLVLYDSEDKMNITSSENSLNATMEKIDEVLGTKLPSETFASYTEVAANAINSKATIDDMTNYIEEHKEELKGDDGYTPIKGTDYWTEAELEEIDKDNKDFIIDELAKRGQLKPEFVNSLEECTDQTKIYVLPDGNLYAYLRGVTPAVQGDFGAVPIEEVSDQYYQNKKQAYSFQKNGAPISGNLKSITVNCVDGSKEIKFAIAHLNGNTIASVDEFVVTTKNGTNTYANGVKFDYQGTIQKGDLIGFSMETVFRPYYKVIDNMVNQCITTTSLTDYTYSEKTYGFAISAVVETPEQVGYNWGNTGHEFVPADYEDRIIALEKSVSEFTPDEEIKISEFTLSNPAVKSFMDEPDYDDNDYSITNISKYYSNEYYRKDLPLPIIIGWNNHDNAVEYAVSITSTTGTQTYYTEHNRIAIYNLIPKTTYNCKVCGLCADGTKVVIKDENFTTADDITRMLNIDGLQNVRDIGGYIALNGNKVKYGMLYRGSAMDETVVETLAITDRGKQELLKNTGVKTDLDLRANITKSILGVNVDFKCVPYHSYVTALTETTYKGYFKTIFEYIVTQLQASKPVYFHCQAGCDRTGTVAFLLLGLLGVSESDLAKEYELSSLSEMGKRLRTRNSTSYNYSGMVEVIKTYSGTTITDKFVSYATECGISSDTITTFRSLMLE